MKEMIITIAILLISVTVANAARLRCEMVQVLPGIFISQCESTHRNEYRNHYRVYDDRWGNERGSRHNRYTRSYYGKKRHPRIDKDIYDRPYLRDNQRW